MGNKLLPYLIFFLMLIIIHSSCSEDPKPTPYVYSRVFTGKTSKTWTIDKVVLRQTGKSDIDQHLQPCGKDDRYIFYSSADKLYEVTNGPSQCNSDESATLISYVWSFNNASASLNIVLPHVFGNYIIPFTVLKAEGKDMQLQIYFDDKNTVSYVFYFK